MSTLPEPDTTADDLSPERRQDLLELAEFIGLDDAAEGLRGDMRTERILPRLKRALDLIGLPISTGPDTPGVVVTLLGTAAASWQAGSVAVEWRPSAALITLDDEADAGDPVDHFTRSVYETLDTALAATLRKAGLHVLIDSQFGGVIIADTRPVDHLNSLGL
ncbi:hypothetical protein ACFVHI_02500 [Kitasatospora sp. NPDC127121]|uniref:hypothetical protein n=1 Tax=unclassified Kitasatospora TaxID=2633591 RepID=UPI0036290654